MKNVYGYIRVSTKKQGDGVSLEVQKDVITNFAKTKNLNITKWFVEKKSASKGFRPEFSRMMADLYDKQADGFIAHKIDRMMRNRDDWASLNHLIDKDYEIHSASESINFKEPSGRFVADVQAAQATNYSFNLSREAKKGLYGRLKQGIFPFRAPLGYLDRGGGKIKAIDRLRAPLIQRAFQLYAQKGLSIRELIETMHKLGLRNWNGNKVAKNSMIKILKNPFYIGIMTVKGESYQGKHKPIIDISVYNKVQEIMSGKANARVAKHDFIFRRMLNCECGYKLVGERQKGHVYYRCHTKSCETKSMRESKVSQLIMNFLATINLSDKEKSILFDLVSKNQEQFAIRRKEILKSINLQLGVMKNKLEKITNLLIKDLLSEDQYSIEKQKILSKERELLGQRNKVSSEKSHIYQKMQNFLELANSLEKTYELGSLSEKRELLKIVTSNLQVKAQKLLISTQSPFDILLNRDIKLSCGDTKPTPRTFSQNIAYQHEMTSPIKPKPLNDKQCVKFYSSILENTHNLPDLNLSTYHEI